MARGLNRVQLCGHLGAEPEMRYSPGGFPTAVLNIATSESIRDKATGTYVERTEWHRVIFFSRAAEMCEKIMKKGDKLFIEGKLKTRKWVDKNKNDRYTLEIIGTDFHLTGGNRENYELQGEVAGIIDNADINIDEIQF